jgi:inhibitor of cysteine peptidase
MLRMAVPVWCCALLLLASGCASGSAGSAPASGTNAPVTLGERDSGSSVSIGVGQKLNVVLDSNPTTGYRWAIDSTPSACLAQAGESTYAPTPVSAGVTGSGGKETWVFEGQAAGQTSLKLKYWRSFEPTVAPVSVFEVTVRVR